MSLSERELILRFRDGDRDTFEEVVRRWNQDMTNLAYRMTGQFEEAQDIAQQCFLRAFQSRESFQGQSSLGTWLYRITVNLCRDRIRADQSRRRMMDSATAQRPRPFHRPARASAGEQGENQAQIARAMGMLPQAQREVVILRHYHDLSCREIAELLDTPYTTVKSRLSQGLDRLRLQLRELNPCAS